LFWSQSIVWRGALHVGLQVHLFVDPETLVLVRAFSGAGRVNDQPAGESADYSSSSHSLNLIQPEAELILALGFLALCLSSMQSPSLCEPQATVRATVSGYVSTKTTCQ
jgi:hypothetical protein